MEQNEAPMGQEELSENNQTIEDPQAEQNEASSASMESLLEEEGVGLDFPKQGEIRTGVIASLGENEILVSIGTKSEGVIPSRELEHIPDDVRAEFSVGSEILVFVVNPEDQSGGVLLSYTRAMEEQDWKLAEELLQSGETYEGEVIGFNKGGLLVPMGQLRGFVPGSQISVLRRFDASGSTPEQRWGTLIGENLIMRVIEVDRERRRLILSERAALQETRETLKDRLLIELKEGDIRTGRVTSLADFGAFVNIDGADGLVHLSELSWERIEHPREVLKVGQEVEVKIIGVDQDRKRIGLSMRQLQPDPWMKKVVDIREGQLVEGTITHLTKFGAFASLGEDLEGLIHISELSEQRVAHPKEVLHEGDVVTLRVIKIEPERRRIGLSLRKVDSPAYTDLDWKTTLAEIVEGEAADDETPADTAEVVEEIAEAVEAEAIEEAVEAAEALEEALEVAETAEVVEEVAEAVEAEAIEEAVEAAEALEEALEVAETAEVVEEIAEAVEAEAIEEAVEAAEALEEALEVAETAEVVEEIAEAVEAEAIEEAVVAAEALEEALEVAETAEVVEEIAEAVEAEAIEEAVVAAEAVEEALEVAEAAEQVEEMAEEVESEALADAAVAAEALEEAEDLSEAAVAAEALADSLKVSEEAEALEEMAEEVQAEAFADAAESAEALEEAIEVAEEAEAVAEIAEAVEVEALLEAAEAEEALEEAVEVAEEAEAVAEIAEAVETEALIEAVEAEEALEEAIEVAEEAEIVEEIAEEVEAEALIEAVEAEEALEEAVEVAEEAEVVEEIAEEVEAEALIEAAEAEADAETSVDEGTAGEASES